MPLGGYEENLDKPHFNLGNTSHGYTSHYTTQRSHFKNSDEIGKTSMFWPNWEARLQICSLANYSASEGKTPSFSLLSNQYLKLKAVVNKTGKYSL